MGKKARASPRSQKVRDVLPNRRYITVTWAAASTTAVYSQFDTMMGAREGAGWLISRMDVMFGGAVPPTPANNPQAVRFQLATGAQVATLAPGNDEVIATVDRQFHFQTNGFGSLDWPLTWVGPVLIASRQLTCSMDASADSAPFQSSDMLFTIYFQWVILTAREWVEIAEARGIA